MLIADGGDQFQAVDGTHPQIGEDEIRRRALDALQRFFAAGGIVDHETGFPFQDFARQRAIDGAVVDNQDSRHEATSWDGTAAAAPAVMRSARQAINCPAD